MGLATLLGATTVNAFVTIPRALPFAADDQGLPPGFDAQIEKLVLAIMLMPCDHREPGYPDVRVADLRDMSPGAAD
jgi:hypothetical protein